jgi:16S rRNA (guanine966-N2)-methyltransferase
MLKTPPGSKTRPTLSSVREALFNICQQEIDGAIFLDLFAGSGAIGIEALSRGAQSTVFVESDRATGRGIQNSLKELGCTGTVVRSDALTFLQRTDETFDLIFADPPYQKDFGQRVVQVCDERSLLREGGRLFVEESEPLEEITLLNLQFVRSRTFGNSTLTEYGVA